MSIEGLFQSSGMRIADFFRIQSLLYRNDPSLQDYFMQLQLDARSNCIAKPKESRLSRRLFHKAIRSVDSVSRLQPRRKLQTDVLFCPMPYFGRKTENEFLIRTLLGLAQTDAKVLCLLPDNAPFRTELVTQLEASKRRGQVEFIDPTAVSNRVEARLRSRIVRARGATAFERTVSILEPLGLGPSPNAKWGFEHLAYYVEAWERLAQDVEFEFVVARCHWHALCSPVCRTGLQRGRPVITFQQGVIGHTLDVPVTASKYVAFGQSSASFLSQMNRKFIEVCGLPEPATEYIAGGSLYDTVTALQEQFALRTVLMVDVNWPTAQAEFYGVESQCQALLEVAEKLLRSNAPLRRLIIRPHPFWNNLDFEACQRLIRKHSMRCELSHPTWSLEDDLRRSSTVVGICSGVLTIASACGLPTFFIQTDRGYTTGDLACFAPGQTLLPDAMFNEISRILKDRNAYLEARLLALRNASEYYKDGENADLSGKFFERLLVAKLARGVQVESIQ